MNQNPLGGESWYYRVAWRLSIGGLGLHIQQFQLCHPIAVSSWTWYNTWFTFISCVLHCCGGGFAHALLSTPWYCNSLVSPPQEHSHLEFVITTQSCTGHTLQWPADRQLLLPPCSSTFSHTNSLFSLSSPDLSVGPFLTSLALPSPDPWILFSRRFYLHGGFFVVSTFMASWFLCFRDKRVIAPG